MRTLSCKHWHANTVDLGSIDDTQSKKQSEEIAKQSKPQISDKHTVLTHCETKARAEISQSDMGLRTNRQDRVC